MYRLRGKYFFGKYFFCCRWVNVYVDEKVVYS